MKELARINLLLCDISYKEDWSINAKKSKEGRMYLQVVFPAPCTLTGKTEMQKCRKWWLSPFMTDTEVVTTAYKAVEAAETHELREKFQFKGRRIFDPHFNVNDLVKLCDIVELDRREDQ